MAHVSKRKHGEYEGERDTAPQHAPSSLSPTSSAQYSCLKTLLSLRGLTRQLSSTGRAFSSRLLKQSQSMSLTSVLPGAGAACPRAHSCGRPRVCRLVFSIGTLVLSISKLNIATGRVSLLTCRAVRFELHSLLFTRAAPRSCADFRG